MVYLVVLDGECCRLGTDWLFGQKVGTRQTFWLLSSKVEARYLLLVRKKVVAWLFGQRIGKRSQVLAIEGILGRRENCCRQTLLKVGGKAPLLLEIKIQRLVVVDQDILSREDDCI